MNTHWTERSTKDFLFRIAMDFIYQLENRMESIPVSQSDLAKKLGKTKGRISQIFNNPGNISLRTIIEYSRALNMKVAIVAYDDNDPDNKKGPVNSEIFKICWEKIGKPRDFWAFHEENNEVKLTFKTAIADRILYTAIGSTLGVATMAKMDSNLLPIVKPVTLQPSVANQG